jgi:cytochrome b6
LALYDWFEERLELQSISDDILSKFVPAHVNIFYCFGGLVLTAFLLQVASGFALTMYYRPTVVEAFSSVQTILFKVHFGWINRSLHRWSSGLMVLSLILHVSRVYLTGGFKKPRELIWFSGVLLSVGTVSFGVTGYSLPWDQIGYWASKIVTAVPESFDELIPGLGSALVLLLRGGYSVGQATLTRFYSAHTFVLPLLTLVLLIIHFAMLRKQSIDGFRNVNSFSETGHLVT